MTLEEQLEQLLGKNLAEEVMLILLPRMACIEFPERDINGRAGIMMSIGPDDPTPEGMAVLCVGESDFRLGLPIRYRDGKRLDE